MLTFLIQQKVIKKIKKQPLVPSVSQIFCEHGLRSKGVLIDSYSHYYLQLSGLLHLDGLPEISLPPPLERGSAINFTYIKTIWPDVTKQELDVEMIQDLVFFPTLNPVITMYYKPWCSIFAVSILLNSIDLQVWKSPQRSSSLTLSFYR